MDKSYELVNTLKGFHNALNSYQLKIWRASQKALYPKTKFSQFLFLNLVTSAYNLWMKLSGVYHWFFQPNRIHYIHEHFLHLYPDHKLTLAELQLLVNLMDPFCSVKEIESACVYFVPPTEVCLRCKNKLILHNKPCEITFYSLDGIQHGVKLCLQCKLCGLNYNYSTYGNNSEGNKFYEQNRPAIEASDSTFVARTLFEFYCSLAYVLHFLTPVAAVMLCFIPRNFQVFFFNIMPLYISH